MMPHFRRVHPTRVSISGLLLRLIDSSRSFMLHHAAPPLSDLAHYFAVPIKEMS